MKDQIKHTAFAVAFAFALVLLLAVVVAGAISIAYSEPGSIYGLGASLFTLPANRTALLEALDETGGFTINLKPDSFPAARYAVAVGSEFDKWETPRLNSMPASIAENLCKKAVRKGYRETVDGIGAWTDESGVVHVEGVRFYATKASAMEVARRKGETAIFDLHTKDVLYV